MAEQISSHHDDQDAKDATAPAGDAAAGPGNTEAEQLLDELEHRRPSAILRLLKRLSADHLFLSGNAAFVLVLSVWVFWLLGRNVQAPPVREPATPVAPIAATRPAPLPQQEAARPKEALGVSWERAKAAFAGWNYADALREYELLYKQAQGIPMAGLVSDYLELRMGECLEHLGQMEQAGQRFIRAAASRSPAVRAVSNYRLAEIDQQKGQYFQARMRAYQALADIAPLARRSSLEMDCDFLIAKALTEKILSFYPGYEPVVWTQMPQSDPFGDMDEGDLRKVLEENTEELADAALGPKLSPNQPEGQVPRWGATCWQASLEDLLGRLATLAKIDLEWASVDGPIRQRSVSLYFDQVSTQRLCEVAAGSAGLVGRFTGNKMIVHNPAAYQSLDEQRELLLTEAMSVWQRLFLRDPQGERAAMGHFALSMLYEYTGKTPEAMNEYRLTAERFKKSPVAPLALLRGARARMQLRDYAGAEAELTRLLDAHPGCRQSGEAYATLGEVTMKAGRPAEAFDIFKKAFFLDASSPSRNFSCFGAGKCLYQKGDYKEATKWLRRYVSTPSEANSKNLAEAYVLLGRSCVATGDLSEAVAAFDRVLTADAAAGERTEALLELARVYLKLGDFSKAIAAVCAIDKNAGLTAQIDYQVLAVTAEVYRASGLPDKAASLLRGAMPAVADPTERAKLRVELARCLRDAKQPLAAHDVLTEAMQGLPPGASACQAACDLAEVCLEIDRPQQAITIAGEVLNLTADADLRLRAQKLLAAAYLARQEYENVLLVSSAEPTGPPGGKGQ